MSYLILLTNGDFVTDFTICIQYGAIGFGAMIRIRNGLVMAAGVSYGVYSNDADIAEAEAYHSSVWSLLRKLIYLLLLWSRIIG